VIGLARPVSGIGQTDGQNWQNNAAMFMQSMLTRDKKKWGKPPHNGYASPFRY